MNEAEESNPYSVPARADMITPEASNLQPGCFETTLTSIVSLFCGYWTFETATRTLPGWLDKLLADLLPWYDREWVIGLTCLLACILLTLTVVIIVGKGIATLLARRPDSQLSGSEFTNLRPDGNKHSIDVNAN